MDAGPSRVRPTASTRRRRARPAELIISDAPSPPAEAVDEDMPARDEEDEAVGPCPGGPQDESVLISFRTHIAASIWRQQVLFVCYRIFFNILLRFCDINY